MSPALRILFGSLVASLLVVAVAGLARQPWLAAAALLPPLAALAWSLRALDVERRELRVRRQMAELSERVAGLDSYDAVASDLVRACGEAFDAGEATLLLPTQAGEPRVWRWRHPQGAASSALRVPVRNAAGGAGELLVSPRVGRRRFRDRDLPLLGIAASAATLAARQLTTMSELRQEKERLEEANGELEDFTLWTTHDMREPLRSVGTLAKILHDELDQLPPEEARDLTQRIVRSADGLKNRIKALHEFSRVMRPEETTALADLNELYESARSGLDVFVAERRAQVRLLRALPVAHVQAPRFEKILANLLENALKYNDKERPVVELSWRDAPDCWEFSVRDNGPGIDPAHHARIFQLFQRGAAARQSGSGAGLAIVKRIVEQHGGRVWVESVPGHGADFRFTLPKPPAEVEVPAPAAPSLRTVPVQAPARPPADEAPGLPS